MTTRIGLVLYANRPVSTYPSVVNTADLLVKNGYSVTLFISADAKIDHPLGGVEIVSFERTRPILLAILSTLLAHAKTCDFLLSFQGDDELIAVGVVATLRRIPFAHFSLEIAGLEREEGIASLTKRLGRILFGRRAAFTIAQDSWRKELVRKAHRILENSIHCVPNSYIGTVRTRTRVLRDTFGIEEDQTVVLYAGGIESWALDEALVKAVDEWDHRYVLVLHGWSRDGYLQALAPLIEDINAAGPRIFVSQKALDMSQYERLISSADIGLAWYKRNASENVRNMGLSSGKLAFFLRCGIPVVAPSYMTGYRQLFGENHFGALVDNEPEIGSALDQILADYPSFRSSAFAFFKRELDFEKRFNDVLPLIEGIAE